MSSPYQEFAQKARERFLEKRKKMAAGTGQYQFTLHAQYKMRQYGLSEQRVKSVIRNPKRREEGIVKDTVAVMQPPSIKRDASGKEVWTQEIWVMYTRNSRPTTRDPRSESQSSTTHYSLPITNFRVISAWRYPGMSPQRHPIPEEILRELQEGCIVEGEEW